MLKILYFATLRERMGRAEEDLALPPGIDTVAALIQTFADRCRCPGKPTRLPHLSTEFRCRARFPPPGLCSK